MRVSKWVVAALPLAEVLSSSAGRAAVIYNGNGAAGFGGTVGNGSVAISDTTAGLTITFNRGSSGLDNALDLYLDTQPGGFADTSTFADNGDGGREALSGFNAGNPSRTVATFPAGFGADYGISIENGFIGVFQLASGGNNSLNYLFGQGQSGNDSDASYSITLTPAELNQIGITGVGQTFEFVGTYISNSAYRSNETIGPSVTTPEDGAGNAAFTGSTVFTAADAYTTVAVPEPASIGLVGLAGIALVTRRRASRR